MTDQQPTPSTAPATGAARWRAVGHWLRDTGLGITGFLIVLGVALAGWTASFIGLHQFGVQHMAFTKHEGWLVPITFDGAAAGLSLVVFRASVNGRGAGLWRVLIIAFTALSSWINYVHITDPTGRWIACYMPPSAVILFEGLMSEARAAAAKREGRERARVHLLRWFFDFSGTLDLYRQYVLAVELPDPLQQSAANHPANPESEPVCEPVREPAEGSAPVAPHGSDQSGTTNPARRTTPRRTRRTSSDQPNQQVREPGGTNDTPSPAEQVKQVLNLMEVHGYDAVKLGFVMEQTGMTKTTAYNRLVEARANWSEESEEQE